MTRVVLAATATSALVLNLGCEGPPQKRDEASITFRASFHAEPGASTKVIFPWVDDPTSAEVLEHIQVSDGGTFFIEQLFEGPGFGIQGLGDVEATFTGARVTGLEGDTGIPEARLTLQQPDAGSGSRYMKVNKAGTAIVQVEFEYSASRNCGDHCGGSRSWSYSGPVGLSVQQVDMTFSEAKR